MPRVLDYYMTEKSLRDGFGDLFGAPCDVFAKLLYIKSSKSINYKKLSIVDFYQLFA